MSVSIPHRRWTLVLTATASLMVALDLLVVATALPSIGADLGASVTTLQWTVTAYGLAFASLLLPAAALGDRFGRRRVFTLGLALFGVASAACALAPDVGWLISARVVQGAGAAIVMPLALALLGAAFPVEERGRALGMLEGATGLATIAGPPLGGVVAQTLGWEWIFGINVPIAVVAIPLVLRHIADDRSEASPTATLDLRGMTMIAGGALAVIWALVRGVEAGWARGEVLAVLALGVGLVVAFVRWERRIAAPMLPLSLFRSRAFSVGTAVSVLLFAALYGSVFLLGQLMQTGLGYDPATAGLALVPWTACLLVVAPVAGAVADRVGHRALLVAGLALNAVGLAWFALVASPGVAYGWLLAALLVAGVGTSTAIPVVQSCVLGAVPASAIGQAAGVNNASQEYGGVFGVAVLATVLTAAGGTFLDGAVPALLVAAGLAAAGAVMALLIPSRSDPAPAAPAGASHDAAPEPTR